jgi:signal transduction histidine kinase
MHELRSQAPQILGKIAAARFCLSRTHIRNSIPLHTILRFPLLSLTAFFCFWACSAEPQIPSRKNVIVITEVGISHAASILMSQELQRAFIEKPNRYVEIYTESLDVTTFSDARAQNELRNGLILKYRDLKMDAIIAMGPEAILFVSTLPKSFFPGVPIVICCSTKEQAGSPSLDSRITGTWFEVEPQKTLDSALKLLPETRHVYIVGGSSGYDRITEKIITSRLNSHQSGLTFSYLTNLEMGTLIETVRHLPPNSIVLYTSLFRDGAGAQFLNATVALPLVANASNAPVFGMSDTYIGNGAVGGCVLSFSEQTKIVADIVLNMLNGARAEDIPITVSPSVFVFDWKELKRWHLREADLPAGSIVMLRDPSLWEGHRGSITTIAVAILLLLFLTIYSWLKRNQVQEARNSLIRLSGMLINSQEKERRRLASELHDDFSQRMALLSLGLETVEELIPRAPLQACDQVHGLIDSASEIGADLHTVSHRLHSSTLERLGLVPGISSFCKEFAAQKNMQIEFRHDSIPRNVSPDIALCLFRIVQEALRNVKKHSGATQAEVVLRIEGKCLHLSICDQGIGFEMDQSHCRGLGLFSMAERCRLQGGELKIDSAPQRGTTIDARLPIHYQAERVTQETEPGNAKLFKRA